MNHYELIEAMTNNINPDDLIYSTFNVHVNPTDKTIKIDGDFLDDVVNIIERHYDLDDDALLIDLAHENLTKYGGFINVTKLLAVVSNAKEAKIIK